MDGHCGAWRQRLLQSAGSLQRGLKEPPGQLRRRDARPRVPADGTTGAAASHSKGPTRRPVYGAMARFPCPGCHADMFAAAVAKAEVMHGLTSAPDAMYVRWVSDVSAVELSMLLEAVGFILASNIIGLAALFLLGRACWYWGAGAGARGPEQGPPWNGGCDKPGHPHISGADGRGPDPYPTLVFSARVVFRGSVSTVLF
ncbi:unnamed protein product [Prorocentrum cordatum]|uniref:Copper transporter n=1 Tax=Prorocentrum cordatum TaxID=2364126 RepID=A0ABN9PS94_9DINO|nr:unnamed protein product [Polarella glacialis]